MQQYVESEHVEQTPSGQEVIVYSDGENQRVRMVFEGVIMVCTFNEDSVDLRLADAYELRDALNRALAWLESR